MTLSVSVESLGLPPIPPGRLYRVDGTATLSDDDWKRVAAVPGSFFVQEKYRIPAGGNIALHEHLATGRYPDPLYVPTAQAHELSGVLGALPSAQNGHDPGGLRFVPKGVRLEPYQEDGIAHLIRYHRAIIFLPTGSGKTEVAMVAAREMTLRNMIDRTVVVAPRGLVGSIWSWRWSQYYPDDPPVQVMGSPRERSIQWLAAQKASYVVTALDTPRIDPKGFRSLLGPRTLVVVDEVHNLKSPHTKRWRALRDALDETGTEYRAFLTGTLLYDKPLDAFGPVDLLGLHVWNTLDEFHRRYFTMTRISTSRRDRDGNLITVEVPEELKGRPEAEALRRAIDAVAFRRTEEEVALHLPPLRREERVVEATPKELDAYERIIIAPLVRAAEEPDLQRREDHILALMTMEQLFSSDPSLVADSESETAEMLRQTVSREELRKLSPGSKARALIEHLSDFLEETETEKAVVFVRFEKFLELLDRWLIDPTSSGFDEEGREQLDRVYRAAVYYHGGMSNTARDVALEAFLKKPQNRLFFATDAGGVGLDGMQNVARQVVQYELPLSLGLLTQRIGRVLRRGQTKKVLEVSFELAPEKALFEALPALTKGMRFVDARLRDLMDWKVRQREMVFA